MEQSAADRKKEQARLRKQKQRYREKEKREALTGSCTPSSATGASATPAEKKKEQARLRKQRQRARQKGEGDASLSSTGASFNIPSTPASTISCTAAASDDHNETSTGLFTKCTPSCASTPINTRRSKFSIPVTQFTPTQSTSHVKVCGHTKKKFEVDLSVEVSSDEDNPSTSQSSVSFTGPGPSHRKSVNRRLRFEEHDMNEVSDVAPVVSVAFSEESEVHLALWEMMDRRVQAVISNPTSKTCFLNAGFHALALFYQPLIEATTDFEVHTLLTDIRESMLNEFTTLREKKNILAYRILNIIKRLQNKVFKNLGKEEDDATTVIRIVVGELRNEILLAGHGRFRYGPFVTVVNQTFHCGSCGHTSTDSIESSLIELHLNDVRYRNLQTLNIQTVVNSVIYDRFVRNTTCECGHNEDTLWTCEPGVHIPQLIILQLHRSDDNEVVKIMTPVETNHLGLEICNHKYTLKGFCAHYGDTAAEGHWVAGVINNLHHVTILSDSAASSNFGSSAVECIAKASVFFYQHEDSPQNGGVQVTNQNCASKRSDSIKRQGDKTEDLPPKRKCNSDCPSSSEQHPVTITIDSSVTRLKKAQDSVPKVRGRGNTAVIRGRGNTAVIRGRGRAKATVTSAPSVPVLSKEVNNKQPEPEVTRRDNKSAIGRGRRGRGRGTVTSTSSVPVRSMSPLSRREYNRKKKAESRRNLSVEEQADISASDTQRLKDQRANETEAEKVCRVDANRERNREFRRNLSVEEQADISASNTQRLKDQRANETTRERDCRLKADKEHHRERISVETEAEKVCRLKADKEHHREFRRNLSVEEQDEISASNTQRLKETRANENIEERMSRLEANRERNRNFRNSLTEEEQADRSLADIQRLRSQRLDETEDERDERLTSDRERHLRLIEDQDEEAARAKRKKRLFDRRMKGDPDKYKWFNEAAAYVPGEKYRDRKFMNIGAMNELCGFGCLARRFPGEPPGMCCVNGKVKLPPFEDPPEFLAALLNGDHVAWSSGFRRNIRLWNGMFQMTSFAAKQHWYPGGVNTFKVSGQVYHRAGSLVPDPGEPYKFLQIYFMSNLEEQANMRSAIFNQFKPNKHLVRHLQAMFHELNEYVKDFKTAMDDPRLEESAEFRVVINPDKNMVPSGAHQGICNAPRTPEVAVLLVGDIADKRSIALKKRGEGGFLEIIDDSHRAYDPLQYPILHPRGEDGHHRLLTKNLGRPLQVDEHPKKLTLMDYYAYRMMIRDNDFNILTRCGDLSNQYWVDMWAKIESDRLCYVRMNQAQLRAATYQQVLNADANGNDAADIGRLIVLPSSFVGSQRYMNMKKQDAMAYCYHWGHPCLFNTITFNPNWPEVLAELRPGETCADRQDVVARVFRRKVVLYWKLCFDKQIFGELHGGLYAIEWQKRGLPHLHSLLFKKNKLRIDDVDDYICAEIPDPEKDPELYRIIIKHNIHGPCGPGRNMAAPCMVNGKCKHNYPKKFQSVTARGDKAYPLYRRRSPAEGGRTVTLTLKNGNIVVCDNRDIVPYNPMLAVALDCHTNTEAASSIRSVHYITGYVTKGSDIAVMDLQDMHGDLDEIKRYQVSRYICANQAVWRILGFPIHEHYPPVMHLTVHLENGQRRLLRPNANLREVLDTQPRSTLDAFFELCQVDELAKTLLYREVPKYFAYVRNPEKKKWEWQRRKTGDPYTVNGIRKVKVEDTIGRVYQVHPKDTDCFMVRLLLSYRRGPTSFEDLRTVNEELLSYHTACIRLGLVENDDHWHTTLDEAFMAGSVKRLRELFAIIIVQCHVSDPLALWEAHKENLTEDIFLRKQEEGPEAVTEYTSEMFNESLILLEDIVVLMDGRTLDKYKLITPNRDVRLIPGPIMERERSYDVDVMEDNVRNYADDLLPEQKAIFDAVWSSVVNGEGKFFHIDAPGGTGKTYLVNMILDWVRLQDKVALAVASSGIASTLMRGGRTAHSTFKLPLNLVNLEDPCCMVDKGTDVAHVLENTELIIWDEFTMSHRHAFEAVDRTLRDIKKCDRLFGGVTVVASGDYRQTLPIIPRGSKFDEIAACLHSSRLWEYVQTYRLTVNMRARLAANDATAEKCARFAEVLKTIGDGTINVGGASEITIPAGGGKVIESSDELMRRVYPNIATNYENNEWLCKRAILCATNAGCNYVNRMLAQKIPTAERTYSSLDTTVDKMEAIHYPVEYLNTLEPSGMPPHELIIKIGMPVMLIRNVSPPKLVNGTRLKVKRVFDDMIDATILTGVGAGEDVYIPKMPLQPSDYVVKFQRLQLPIRICFAMTLNKSQGQTLHVCGLHLDVRCFGHGQYYVGCSRVGNPDNLFIFAPGGKTDNIVYREATPPPACVLN